MWLFTAVVPQQQQQLIVCVLAAKGQCYIYTLYVAVLKLIFSWS